MDPYVLGVRKHGKIGVDPERKSLSKL